MGADLSLEEIPHDQDRIGRRPLAHQTEEAVELLGAAKKRAVDAAKLRRKGAIGAVFIEKQLPGLHGIVERVVQGAGLELVVLHQGVVGPHGKEQRRQTEGVDGQILGREDFVDIAQIVGDDVVSADKGIPPGERRQRRGRCRMQLHPIRTHGTDVQDLPGLRLDLRIKKTGFSPPDPLLSPKLTKFSCNQYIALRLGNQGKDKPPEIALDISKPKPPTG